MKIKSSLLIFLKLLAVLQLTACGQRGPLFHPEPPPAIPEPAEQNEKVTKPTQ